ncbi:methyltransferase domain-containing protein [Pseudolabrys taiwanensis]|uniref:Methyltransferase domain-containing protein n=1 Tax=Pseudolabrys taiwanensis TaxID=331696 RepID=A0A345ZXN5_9HYPH|nr:methyltransferase domain-containing protein [Pseudolabrys taiwanensis]AXK81682.1 methyltransferase domain-containing protein [Pseudolabrys taiwanensis]
MATVTRPASSGDLLIDRRFEWARESLAAGDAAGAADLLGQLLELAPRYAPAWFLLGEAREQLGDGPGAAAAFESARAADPEDGQGAVVRLARLGAVAAAPMPAGYVRALFDGYAPQFDQALTEGLGYRGPEVLLQAVERACAGRRFARALDLGCGTGLAGVAFQLMCDELTGVDLSPRMLAVADSKGVYNRLVEGDVMQFAIAESAAERRYDLILAADVFMYFHDLAAFRDIAPLLEPGGLFAFTVETYAGDGALLRDTLRYAHGEAHVRDALRAAGLTLVSLHAASTRTEKGVPVPGLVVVARRPSS